MKQDRRGLRHLLAFSLLFSFIVSLPTASIAAPAVAGTAIVGRILDAQGGLPVPNATVDLGLGASTVATTTTDASGNFRFAPQAPGTYSITIRANGYQTTRAPELAVTAGEAEVTFQTAINRSATGLKQIASVATAGRGSLQTSSTINTHIDTSLMQSENYQRLGDILTTVPGVITSTSSSVGDDMSLSIRGFDSTETATLLDGHPIGPIGAFGGGYNYNVSPFWGLSGVDVIFGSGATGLFGATTMAGAVNFQSVNPTQGYHVSVTQGVGSDDKLMTGMLGTGTVGKLGYAFAWGVQGTNGNFPGAMTTQRALLQSSVVHPGITFTPPPASPTAAPVSSPPPPDLTSKNINSTLNTYWVSGQYSQYNFVGKLSYSFSPKTTLQATAYSANDWSNSTGEGDNDYQTYPYVLYGAQQNLAGILSSPGKLNTILVNGKPKSCYASIAVLVNNAQGYTCMNPVQYATAFYGPFGGSIDRWRTLGNQDYDLRGTQQIGAGVITLEGFADSYNYNEQKGPGSPIGQYTTYGPGPYYLNLYHTRGYLLSDDYASAHNDLAFGYTWLHQAQTDGAFPYTTASGNSYNVFGNNPQLNLATASYFVRDAWTPGDKFQAFVSAWVQRSLETQTTNFDPRISLVYRPTPNDVIRFTTGRAYSEPDPSLVTFAPPVYGAPSSVNCPSSNSGPSSLTTIASVSNPDLHPETSNDLELAVGHRFNSTTNLQADLYQTWENQALLNGVVQILQVPAYIVPQSLIDQYLSRLDKCPGLNPTINSLAFSTTYNAAAARYRGISLSTNVGITRGVTFNAQYNVQSAAYIGVPQDILQANTSIIDGGQRAGVPMFQGTAGLSYQNPTGFAVRMDTNYIGPNNSYNRIPLWFSNGSISQTSGQVTVNFGVYNIFNNAAQTYGLIGEGVYVPQNYYGLAAQGGPTSAIQQGTEMYGLPFRTYWLTMKVGI